MNFEINKTYSCCSICDSECVWVFKVIKRTAKFVTLEDESGEIFRKKVTVFNGDEQCNPLGNYSMAPILRAEKAVQEVQEVQEVKSKDADEPHYVVQHRSETKKLGIFPSYESASEWLDKNHKNYKGALGIYKVRVYDQEMTVKTFDLSGGRFVPGEVIHESSSAVVTYQGGSRGLKGEYKETETDTEKKNADILIKYANGGSFTISVKPHVIVKGRGVKKQYNSDSYEVTDNYLEKLKKNHSSVCDF